MDKVVLEAEAGRLHFVQFWVIAECPSAAIRSIETSVEALVRSRGVVDEGNLVMHRLADSDSTFSSGLGGSELAAGDSAELVDFAIPARQEKLQNF